MLAGVLAGGQGAAEVRGQDLVGRVAGLKEEAIGGFEFGPVWEGLGQGAGGRAGQGGGDIHEAGRCGFLLVSLGGRGQTGAPGGAFLARQGERGLSHQ